MGSLAWHNMFLEIPNMIPKFIVLEGLDGSGTSTQAELLRQYFTTIRKAPALVTTEPTNGPIGCLIRQAFRQRIHFTNDELRFDEQMAFLFAADRHDHLYNDHDGVLKTLSSGINVISTRYYFSSYAYHCHEDSDFSLVRRLNETFPNPDLVIYLDVPIEISLARLAERIHKDSYENERKLTRVKNNYDRVFSRYTGPLLRVDGTKNINEIHKIITDFIEK